MTANDIERAGKVVSKATIDLVRHLETRAYAGLLLMGNTTIDPNVQTACTDGVNERYSPDFVLKLKLPEVRGLKLHETLHKVFKHTVRGLSYWKKNPQLANQAADYVVNDVIMNLADKAFIKLPDGGLYDPEFHGLSFPEIYRILEQEQQAGGGGGRGDPLDEHDMGGAEQMSAEQIKQYSEQINEALHQGSMMMSRFGKTLPRSITDSMIPKVDWPTAFRDFVCSVANGNDEHTYRKFDRRMIVFDIVQPGVYSEKIGDIVVAIDVSGSISQQQVNEFATELQSICEQVMPDAVRVLWWSDKVEHEQIIYPDQFGDIRKLLKPHGGGGTYVTAVSEYITQKQVKADCVVVFTDGHVESSPQWQVTAPTLWLVTENKRFVPPRGMLVKMD